MCFFAALGTALGASAASATATGLAATSAAIGTASAGMQFAGQRQQAKQQAAYQAQSIAAAQKKKQLQETSALLERQQQMKAVAQEKGKVAERGKAATATARVSAGEAGVSGLSVQALMDDYIRQQAGQIAALTSQDKLYALRHGLNLEQLGLSSEQEILGLSRPIDKPSVLGLGLNVLSSGLSAYGTYQSLQAAARPASIQTSMGTSSYLADTDQYTLPARSPLTIGRR
jgi:hypothetical protein